MANVSSRECVPQVVVSSQLSLVGMRGCGSRQFEVKKMYEVEGREVIGTVKDGVGKREGETNRKLKGSQG